MGQNVGKIWLIGGTSESAEIAQTIINQDLSCVVSVATSHGKNLYPIKSNLTVKIGKLTFESLPEFCEQEQIIAIIDASHPHAIKISQQAIKIAQEKAIPYLRYERSPVILNNKVIELDNFETLIKGDFLPNKRVLLTIGYQALPLFKPWHDQAQLYARILPRREALNVALESGFKEDHLIALRPPINAALEKALWQQWKINLVVSKASGKQGGEDIKAIVASQLGIPLIIIKRPPITYPQQTEKISDIINFCRQYCFAKNHV